jgi:hypothetical protein
MSFAFGNISPFGSQTRLILGLFGAVAALGRGAAETRASDAIATHGLADILASAQVVYDTARDGCDKYDVPDAPARAFRDETGLIHFFSSSSVNRAMIGPRFDRLHRDCQIVYKGAHASRPQEYSDYSWLAAFYARGNTIYGIVHNEFHGQERPELCPSRSYARCWENAIAGVESSDGGYHFLSTADSGGVLAELPYVYKGDQQGQFGYFNPTNILKSSGYYYIMFTEINRVNPELNGVCVARTPTLEDPSSWRGWGGSGFTITFANPYTMKIATPLAHVCRPIGRGQLFASLGSLLWQPAERRFLLIQRLQKWDQAARKQPPGAYFSYSSDLIKWSDPKLLLSDDQAGANTAQLYPAVIDPDSTDQNFSTIGKHALLFSVTMGPTGYQSWKLWRRDIWFQ